LILNIDINFCNGYILESYAMPQLRQP